MPALIEESATAAADGVKRVSVVRFVLALVLLGLTLLLATAVRDTFGAPVIRRTMVEMAGLEPGQPPVRIALLSDIHMGGPDMTPARLSSIIAEVNALRPDIVLIAGDMMAHRAFLTERYSMQDALAPLSQLRAPLGVVAVPGNHDYISGLPLLRQVLQQNGVLLLSNEAQRVGPFAIGAFDGSAAVPGKLRQVVRQMEALPGGHIVLTHSPDVFPQLPANVSLTVAGHTHCGQIALPWGYAPVTTSRFGQRYNCGRVDEDGKVLITSAGLGTSGIPLRLFAPPDIWLIEARPPG